MELTRVAVVRPLFMTMVFLAIAVFGFVAYSRLGVDLLPAINFPVVTVVTSYPGAGPGTVEDLVTVPIEDALSGLNDLDYTTSSSVEGISTVVIVFTERADANAAAIDVERKVNGIRGSLPPEARPPSVVKADINALPILNLALSGPQSVADLTRLAEDRIVPALNAVNGVAAVTLVGSRKREIQVRVDPARLRARGLSILQINAALAQENVEVPSGGITESGKDYNVRLNALALAPEQLGDIVLTANPAGTVRLRDVADVQDVPVKVSQINRSTGRDSVGLLVSKQASGNTVAIAEAVKGRIRSLESTLPSGTGLDVVTDASVFTRRSLDGVQRELIEAVLLVGLVLLAFLHAWRSTLIVLLAIPTSLVATLLAMYVLGFTLNLMSLLGLTLTIGILVDDSIVVLENIFRHLEMGESPMSAAISGRSETGQFFRQFGLVVVVAALFSLLVSFTLTPMLAARWLRRPSLRARSPLALFGRAWESGFSRLTRAYREILGWALRLRWLVVGLGAASFLVGVAMVTTNMVGTEFVPDADQSEFTLIAEMPPGTALEVTDQAVAAVEARLAQWPEVERVFTSVGVAGENRPGQARFARMIVKLSPPEERQMSAQKLASQARGLFEAWPELKLRTLLPSLAGPGGQPIQVQIRGEDQRQLAALARQVQTIVESVPGAQDVDNSGLEGQPAVVVQLDRARAADLGVSAGQVASALRTSLVGSVVSQYRPVDAKAVDIRVLLAESTVSRIDQLRQLPLANSRGNVIQLGQIATFQESVGSPQIDRRDRQRLIIVSGSLVDRALGDVAQDIQEGLSGLSVPPGYSVRLAGAAQEQQQSFGQLFFALGLSILLTYMVTVALYESLVTPLVVMLSLPLATAGAIGALALSGSRLSLLSLIGFIMLVGLVGKNAILLMDYTLTLRRRGLARDEALLEAGPTRLRPILMTTISLVIALLPVALGATEGSELRRPIAIPVIGGMLTSTLLTLVFIPAVYTLVDDAQAALGRRLRRAPSAAAGDAEGIQPRRREAHEAARRIL